MTSGINKIREVPNGVGADGVGVKFPVFPVNCSRSRLFQKNRRKNEEKRRKTKKNEKRAKKNEKKNEKAKKKRKKKNEKEKRGKILRPHLHQPH